MKPARALGPTLAAVLLLGALAVPADAHNISLSPKVGDAASTFVFKGKKWQPGGRVFVDYFESGAANNPFKSFTITARANGKFTFKFIRPVTSIHIGLTPTMCFNQRDTRFARSAGIGGPGRLFTRCKRFFVEPPTARFWPSAGPPGTSFLLMTNGWYPNQRVELDLTRPDGLTETYTDLPAARKRARFIQFGNPFGDVFVRKGETYRLFPGDTSVLVGDYLASVRPASGGGVIRTLVTVTPP
jgi:hypothetical protein